VTDLILFCLIGILNIAIAVLGGHLSSTNHKYKIVFYVLGGISVILVIFAGYRTYQAQIAAKIESKRLDDSIGIVKSMSEETVRIGTLNSQLEKQLLQQSKAITNLSKQAISTTTGGDSFCYLHVEPRGNVWEPTFIHFGKYPIYGVGARIIDLDKFRENKKKNQDFTFQDLSGTSIKVGDMTVGTALPMWNIRIPWSDTTEHAFNVFFSGRNGLWDEFVRLKKIDGKWVQAIQVQKRTENKTEILFSKIDKLFPRNAKGQVEWHELP